MCNETNVKINIPSKDEIVAKGMLVPVARKGTPWKASCLGVYAEAQGVYVLHHGESIIYVGKTDGQTMNFGTRLRRHFQEGASQGKHTFPVLAGLPVPPPIKASLITLSEIRKLVSASDIQLSDTQRVLILELVAIAKYKPTFWDPTVPDEPLTAE